MREKIIYKLANFILVENGNKCIMTHDDLELIKETKQDYEETYSQYEYVIKSFGVKVIKKQAIDSIVLKWEKFQVLGLCGRLWININALINNAFFILSELTSI